MMLDCQGNTDEGNLRNVFSLHVSQIKASAVRAEKRRITTYPGSVICNMQCMYLPSRMVSSSPKNLDCCGYNAPTNQILFNWVPATCNWDVAFAMKPVNNSSHYSRKSAFREGSCKKGKLNNPSRFNREAWTQLSHVLIIQWSINQWGVQSPEPKVAWWDS